jgi:hypothetical protein
MSGEKQKSLKVPFFFSPHHARNAVARAPNWSSRRTPRPPGFQLCKTGRRRGQGWSEAQSPSGASTFLGGQELPPSFPPRPRPKAWPRSPLSLTRLCAFAEQTALPLLTPRGWPIPGASRKSRSPGFLLVKKDGHIRGRSRRFVHNRGWTCVAPNPHLKSILAEGFLEIQKKWV